eukprot:3938431-Rhodomonas_salina.1
MACSLAVMRAHQASVAGFVGSAQDSVPTQMALLKFAIKGYFTVMYQAASEILEFRLRSLNSSGGGRSVAVARFLVPLGCTDSQVTGMVDSVINEILTLDGGKYADRLKAVSADGAHATFIWQAGDTSASISSICTTIRAATAAKIKAIRGDKEGGDLGVSMSQKIKQALYDEYAQELKEYHTATKSPFRDVTRRVLPKHARVRALVYPVTCMCAGYGLHLRLRPAAPHETGTTATHHHACVRCLTRARSGSRSASRWQRRPSRRAEAAEAAEEEAEVEAEEAEEEGTGLGGGEDCISRGGGELPSLCAVQASQDSASASASAAGGRTEQWAWAGRGQHGNFSGAPPHTPPLAVCGIESKHCALSTVCSASARWLEWFRSVVASLCTVRCTELVYGATRPRPQGFPPCTSCAYLHTVLSTRVRILYELLVSTYGHPCVVICASSSWHVCICVHASTALQCSACLAQMCGTSTACCAVRTGTKCAVLA